MSRLMDYTELEALVEKRLKPSRFIHSKGVAAVCSDLTVRFLSDKVPGLYTGIFHDWCRYMSDEELLSFCRGRITDMAREEEEKPMLLHGAAAALMMRDIVGDVPTSWLTAIRHHTLGSTEMGVLGACLYIADYLEPNRKHITESDRAMILSMATLEEMVLEILRREEEYYRISGMKRAERTAVLCTFLRNGGLFQLSITHGAEPRGLANSRTLID